MFLNLFGNIKGIVRNYIERLHQSYADEYNVSKSDVKLFIKDEKTNINLFIKNSFIKILTKEEIYNKLNDSNKDNSNIVTIVQSLIETLHSAYAKELKIPKSHTMIVIHDENTILSLYNKNDLVKQLTDDELYKKIIKNLIF